MIKYWLQCTKISPIQEGGVQRVFYILVSEALISDTASIWFFVLFFLAIFLLVLNRFSARLSFSAKPIVV